MKRKPSKRFVSDFDGITKFQIEALVDAGFAYRFIAGMISGKPPEKVTDQEIRAVMSYTYSVDMGVTAYRLGQNEFGKLVAERVTRGKKRRSA